MGLWSIMKEARFCEKGLNSVAVIEEWKQQELQDKNSNQHAEPSKIGMAVHPTLSTLEKILTAV